MRSQEHNCDLPAAASSAFEAVADVFQREVIAELRAEVGKTETSGVQAGATRTAIIIIIDNVLECCRFKSDKFHARNVHPISCEFMVDNSYSIRRT